MEHLRTHFMFRYGRENVFMDFDSIPAFTRFEDFIRQKVRESDIVVPIIGGRWLELLNDKAAKGETDYVRLELDEALTHGKLIAPVFIQGAKTPPRADVPPELRPLLDLNIPSISAGRDLLDKVGGLMDDFERLLAARGVGASPANPTAEATLKPPAQLTMKELMGRFVDAVKANDYPQALIWAAEMRAAGGVPGFFRLDEREAAIQTRLKAAEEARRRREVADYLYDVVRWMVELEDEAGHIRAALDEVWAVDAGYDPDELAAKLPKPHLIVLDLLPSPFEWIDIPAGRVTLIPDEQDKKNSYLKQDTTYDVAAFAIAKYPITNAQYAKFVEAGGYRERRWWTDAGWAQREKDKWTEPRYWTDSKWNGADYPVVGVSWYEAVAFCAWLSESSGAAVRLPTEQEWQRAAQGDDGRTYPWGNDWDCKCCNNSVSPCDSNQTTPVKQYEGKGDSFFEVKDMAGNVWEWCLGEYKDGNIALDGTGVRVLRGGSWDSGGSDAFRCDYRSGGNPHGGPLQLGFSSCPLLLIF